MPRYLYLLRHAQSADKQPGQTDLQRELTSIGRAQADRIAAFFRDQKTFPEIIYTSHAERAKITAHLIADALKLDSECIHYQEDLYEASTRTMFNFISQLDDKHHQVLCVAHNPGISYLAEYLTKAEIGEIVPAGMAIIQFNTNSWSQVSGGTGDFLRYVAMD